MTSALSDGDDAKKSVTDRFPASWDAYKWDPMMPQSIRDAVRERWHARRGGSPRMYHANSEDLGVPANGQTVELPRHPHDASRPRVAGRYWHLSGRAGFVVDEASRVVNVRVPLDWRPDSAKK